MAKDTFYFSHDYNTRSDTKIKKLISKLGYEGYGLFWSIIEDLYNNANALPTDYEIIAFDLRSNEKIIKSIINDFDLFVFDGGFFGSLSVQKRLEERNQKSVRARESALRRWNKDANALRTECEPNAIKERKGKERKEKESISFDFFWNLYDKKVGKKDKIQKKWDNLLYETQKKIIDTLPQFLKTISDKKYQPHPETYLNNERWNDEIKPYQPKLVY